MKTIRRIQIGEADLFRQMRLASLQDAPYAFSSTYESALHRSTDSWREQAASTAQGSDRATFIAFSDDVPIGIAALYRLEGRADVGEVVQVWVTPGHRGYSDLGCNYLAHVLWRSRWLRRLAFVVLAVFGSA